MVGVGCDLEQVSALASSEGLRVPDIFFTRAECEYANSKQEPMPTFAGHFAAKEAFFKAIPSGTPFFWTDLEVAHLADYSPRFRFSGQLAKLMKEKRWDTSVSISHSGAYATAMVAVWSLP